MPLTRQDRELDRDFRRYRGSCCFGPKHAIDRLNTDIFRQEDLAQFESDRMQVNIGTKSVCQE